MAKSPDNRERHVPVVTARVISLSQIRMRFGTGSPLGPLTVGPATQPAPTSVRRSAPPHARRPALARSRPSGRSMTLASAARRQQRLLPLLFYLSISSLSISLSPSPSPSPSHSLPPARVVRGPESAARRRAGGGAGVAAAGADWGPGRQEGDPPPLPIPLPPAGRLRARQGWRAWGGAGAAGRGGAGRGGRRW